MNTPVPKSLYRLLVEGIPATLYTAALDEFGNLLYLGPQIEAWLGRPRDEFMASPECWLEHIHPDDRERVQAEHARGRAALKPFTVEYRLLTMEGGEVWVRDLAMVLSLDGQPYSVVGLLLDVTAQKQAEAIQQRYAAELEERVADRTEALEQQYRRQAALAEIELAINQPHELDAVLAQVVEVTTSLLPASGGASLILWDPEREEFVSSASTVPGQAPNLGMRRVRRKGGATRWIVDHREPVVVPDVRDDPFMANQMLPEYELQAYAGVPLLAEGEAVGVLYALDRHVRHYTAEDLTFLKALANRAAAAVVKVRLFESERRQRQLAERLRDIAIAMTSTLDLREVLARILDNLGQVVPYDSATVMLREGEYVQVVATRGIAEAEAAEAVRISLVEDELFAEIARRQKPLVLEDAAADERFHAYGGTGHVRAWIGVPLTAHDEIVGLLTVDSRTPGAYGAHEADIASTFASEAVIALENARLFGEVQRLATTDVLTGVSNRRHFFSLAEREFLRMRRSGQALTAVMLDIDHFKRVNDTYGHAAGDEVLRVVASRCRQSLREIDVLGRYGGEEFAILLPETGLDEARVVAERLREHIGQTPVDALDASIAVTVSIGVAVAEADTPTLAALLGRADAALYAAKEAGRNRVRVD